MTRSMSASTSEPPDSASDSTAASTSRSPPSRSGSERRRPTFPCAARPRRAISITIRSATRRAFARSSGSTASPSVTRIDTALSGLSASNRSITCSSSSPTSGESSSKCSIAVICCRETIVRGATPPGEPDGGGVRSPDSSWPGSPLFPPKAQAPHRSVGKK